MSIIEIERGQRVLTLLLAGLLALSLTCSMSIRQGHADSPIADTADAIKPLVVGDAAPRFIVRDINGDNVVFDPQSLERPVLLISFRGGWCPYCNMHLSELRHVLPAIEDQDVDVLFLSGDRPEQLVKGLQPETRNDVSELGYTLLSDANASAAIALGIAFRSPARVRQWLEKNDKDFTDSSVDRHGVLPVPAVFAIGRTGRIEYAYTNADYRERLPADELLSVASAL